MSNIHAIGVPEIEEKENEEEAIFKVRMTKNFLKILKLQIQEAPRRILQRLMKKVRDTECIGMHEIEMLNTAQEEKRNITFK